MGITIIKIIIKNKMAIKSKIHIIIMMYNKCKFIW